MKILYAIQGTGNGHVSRAREIIPHLEKHGELDILLSGTQADVRLSQDLRWKLHGFSFVFGRKGGVDRWKTWKIMDLSQLRKDINMLPLERYDLIINDFEPVTAWACKLRKIPCIGLSHQSAFLSPAAPRPRRLVPHWAELLFRYYAPLTAAFGFHFQRYDDFIYTPVIRGEIRKLEPRNEGHYTVYLPAHDDRLLVRLLKQAPEAEWEVFSKHSPAVYRDGNVLVQPVNNEKFNESLASCEGLLTAGGFESPAEALFLGKKVFSVPMMGQWEQQCNAEALRGMGVPVVKKIGKEFVPYLKDWIRNGPVIKVHFPDETGRIIEELLKRHS
ncbi:MAG TPA: glycosyltransferase family protein [Anseongella sp.]|nr:glycosyltransferase family protein [Anseongella sp.]